LKVFAFLNLVGAIVFKQISSRPSNVRYAWFKNPHVVIMIVCCCLFSI